jgi:hypothetical protein
MKPWILILAVLGLIAGCSPDTPQRSAGGEGKAAQSAAGGSADEGKAARAAGR